MKNGKQVIAIESFKDGVLRTYGQGVYIGNLIPDVQPFRGAGLKNPCIKLNSGKYVWGYQCWWGNERNFLDICGKDVKETILVEPEENILPLNTHYPPGEAEHL